MMVFRHGVFASYLGSHDVLRIGLLWRDLCPYKKGKTDPSPSLSATCGHSKKKARNLFLEILLEIKSASTLILDFLFSKTVKNKCLALAGVAQWIEHQPENQRVTSWIPSQGPCLGSSPGPQRVPKRQPHIDGPLPLSLPPFPSI